jgi:hypothetical protein
MNKEPKDIEDPDIRILAIKTYKLRETNSAIIGRLERMGSELELTLARLEHFMTNLVTLGILTEGQYWEEQLSWEEDLNNQAVALEINLREQIQAAQAAQRQKLVTPPQGKEKKLLGPGGLPL